MGARHENGVAAHAWVEVEGVAVLGASTVCFERFATIRGGVCESVQSGERFLDARRDGVETLESGSEAQLEHGHRGR